MTQVTRLTNDLVIRAAKLINIFEVDNFIDTPKMTDGIESLNIVLDSFQSGGIELPFREIISFDMAIGVGDYNFGYSSSEVITNSKTLTQLNNVQIQFDTQAKFDVRIVNVQQYNYEILTEVGNTIPEICYLQRTPEFSTVKFYPFPDKSFTCRVNGKFAIEHVQKNQHLDSLPPYAYKFLSYAVARELSSIYPSSSWDVKREKEYETMLEHFRASNDIDLSSRNRNFFNLQYADGSVYNGYTR